MNNSRKNKVCICLLIGFFVYNTGVCAQSNEQIEMQKRLNEEVMSQSFHTADDATLEKSLSDATERGKPTKSKTQTSYYKYWHGGYYYPYWAYSRSYWY